MHDRWSRRIAAAVAASVMLTLLVTFPLEAQAGLGQLDDATTPPRGFLRLRTITAWTRVDGLFTTDGVQPLGGPFSGTAFGADRFAPLGAIQSLVQSATAQPFTLSLGQSRVDATAREEVLPLALEYGITRRLAVGITMPVVRKRATVQFRLDTAGGFTANVGPNLHRTSTSASQTNAAVQSQFTAAVAALQDRLTSCAADPAGAGCAALAGREAEAQQLLQASQGFATAVESLYGSDASEGMAFVPISGSTAQQEIAQRISDFNTQYRDLLASGSDLLVAVPRAAGGIAGVAEFQNFLTDDLGRDSIATQERVGIGDMELGVKFLVLDRPRAPGGRTSLQVALAGGVRLPTGSRDSPSDVVDMRLGEGSVVVDSRAIVDVRAGRFGLLAAGHFASSVHDVDTVGLASRNSRWTDIHLAPRWHLSEPFSIHAAYSMRSTDKLGGDQLVGAGVSFTSLSGFTGIGSPPVEMRFTHLESIRGEAGRPKFFREQLELRIYYRLLGRKNRTS
jgi:hypothetical protein